MEREQNRVGEWGVCSLGRIGHIEDRKQLPWGLAWVGTGIDGKPWSSRNPRPLSAFEATVVNRIAKSQQPSALI
jgi:hypothetical protein